MQVQPPSQSPSFCQFDARGADAVCRVCGRVVSNVDSSRVVAACRPGYQKPSLAKRVANFAKSAVKHVTSGMQTCSQEEIDRRFAICRGCEFYQDGGCVKCGCPLVREKKFISKLSWANEKCPVGKWGQ